jgi:transposase
MSLASPSAALTPPCRLRSDALVLAARGLPSPGRCAAAMAAGQEVRVVPATLVRSLGVGQRGLKTDVRDARVLSEASCRMELPSVHIPSAIAQEVKAAPPASERSEPG